MMTSASQLWLQSKAFRFSSSCPGRHPLLKRIGREFREFELFFLFLWGVHFFVHFLVLVSFCYLCSEAQYHNNRVHKYYKTHIFFWVIYITYTYATEYLYIIVSVMFLTCAPITKSFMLTITASKFFFYWRQSLFNIIPSFQKCRRQRWIEYISWDPPVQFPTWNFKIFQMSELPQVERREKQTDARWWFSTDQPKLLNSKRKHL